MPSAISVSHGKYARLKVILEEKFPEIIIIIVLGITLLLL